MDQTVLQTIIAAIAGGIIIPVVDQLKKFGFSDWIRPEFLTGLLLFGATWAVCHFFAPLMTWGEIVQIALSATGGASIIYGATTKDGLGIRSALKNKNDHSSL